MRRASFYRETLVMLRATKHPEAQRDRPFAALRVTRMGHPIQRRALSALMPSRPRPLESGTCVLV